MHTPAHCGRLLLVAMLAIGLAACESRPEGRTVTTSTPTPAASPGRPAATTPQTPVNPPASPTETQTMATATFGAGCFWQVEEVLRKTPGVIDTAVGYEGGTLRDPTYHDVCTDQTGHVEVVQVSYDPSKVSYEQLLDVYFKCHNPTTLNRQGPDYGSQYRSVIFYHTPEQKAAAEKSKQALDASHRWKRPVVTAIEPAATFYKAEDYHQKYLMKRGLDACHIVEPDGE